MGNAASCVFPIGKSVGCFNKSGSIAKTTMLLDTRGNIRQIKLPVKSAELMIEEIGHVITPLHELRRTRRITAWPADQELLAGKVYLLVPISRVNSRASEIEIATAEKWGCDKKNKNNDNKNKGGQIKKPSGMGNMAKVLPVSTLRESQGEVEFSNSITILSGKRFGGQRFGNQARWNPVLDPIFESS